MGEAMSQQQAEALAATAGALPAPAPPGAVAQGAAAAKSAPGHGGADAPGGAGLCETALISQLVLLLGQRARHSLLLSDLGALLPGPLRHGVKEKGGLRSWLQKYPQLFHVSGQPGKESVTLLIGDAAALLASSGGGGGAAPAAAAAARPQGQAAGQGQGKDNASAELDQRRSQEDEENDSAVQLRGLPYRATATDIRQFLGVHAASLKDDGADAVQLVLNRDGRPSGFARVQFASPAAARAARDALHMKTMEVFGCNAGTGGQHRYVEMFLFSERPNKLRFKKAAASEAGSPGNEEDEDPDAPSASKDQVVSECREHMASPGKGQLLLSMLGVALSQGARLYLKKTNQGLKHFLSQYPQEFAVDGAKGRECVSYLPALAKGGQENSDLPASFSEPQKKAPVRRASEGTGGPASGSISDLQKRWEDPVVVPQSPKVTEHLMVPDGTPKGSLGTPCNPPTPSIWGTPSSPRLGLDGGLGLSAAGGSRPSASAQRLGGEAFSGQREYSGPAASGLTLGSGDPAAPGSAPLSFENWAAWAMPPPTYWPPPSAYWPPPGTSQAPWGPLDGQDAWGPRGHAPDSLLQLLEGCGGAGAGATVPAAERLAPDPGPPAIPSAALAALSAGTGPCNSSWDLRLPSLAPGSAPGPGRPAPGEDPRLPSLAPGRAPGPGRPAPGEEQEVCDSAVVRLRGLPWQVTEQDVLAFFAKHEIVDRVSEEPNAVKLIAKGKGGKPSGQATVRMLSPSDAQLALQVLHGQYIGKRYIEVFHHSDPEGEAPSSGPQGREDGGAGHPPAAGSPAPAAAQPAVAEGPAKTGKLGEEAPGLFAGVGDTGGSGDVGNPFSFPPPGWWQQGPLDLGGLGGGKPGGGGGGGGGGAGGSVEDHAEASWEDLIGFLNKNSMEKSGSPEASSGLGAAAPPEPAARVDAA